MLFFYIFPTGKQKIKNNARKFNEPPGVCVDGLRLNVFLPILAVIAAADGDIVKKTGFALIILMKVKTKRTVNIRLTGT